MAATFEDFLAAGKINTKEISVNGLEIKIRPLTAAETFKAAEIEQKIKDGKANVEDGTMFLIQTSLVEPKLTDEQIKKLGGLSGMFIADLTRAIAAELNPDGAEALAEKN